MENKTVYITIRLDIESQEPITDELMQEVIEDCKFEFSSATSGVKISDAEICGINE